MAKRTGFTVKMDNSDNAERKFDITCEVAVSDDGSRRVSNVSVTKDGVHVANANFGTYTSERPNVSFNIFSLPLADHADCVAEVYAFAAQAKEDASVE